MVPSNESWFYFSWSLSSIVGFAESTNNIFGLLPRERSTADGMDALTCSMNLPPMREVDREHWRT